MRPSSTSRFSVHRPELVRALRAALAAEREGLTPPRQRLASSATSTPSPPARSPTTPRCAGRGSFFVGDWRGPLDCPDPRAIAPKG